MPTRTDHHAIAYRADIDGVRAIAVLAVVFNHIGMRDFHGGFFGVDIFYVISGYLITGIIWKELGTGRFTLATFYRRRILRILPAFYATLALVLVAFIVRLLPSELERLASSAVASELLASNVFFYFGAGYFAPTAGQEPLLHTWSLAVEEQFYVFLPLILWAVHRIRAQAVVAVTVLIARVSCAMSVRLLWLDTTANFYLIPSAPGNWRSAP